MRRIGIVVAAVVAAGALWAAAPSVTINSVQQRYPWNNKIDVVYTLELDKTHAYGLKFKVQNGDAAVNTVTTDLEITPAQKLTSYVGTNTIDLTGLIGFNEVLAKTTPEITGVLIDKGFVPDPDALDAGDGVTFVPGDYLVLTLSDGTITTNKNVQSASAFQDNEYKTTKMVFRKVPVGSFMMQSQDTVNNTYNTGTKVKISKEYYIAIYPCTQKQYKQLANALPSTKSQVTTGDTYPCGRVMWTQVAGGTKASSSASSDILTILNNKVSAKGYQASLPNEAQWERASRAGSTQTYFFGPNETNSGTGRKLSDYAYYNGDAFGTVGSKSPNAWGLYDVYGNVFEWCQDWYAASLNYSQQPGGPSSGTDRVLRGGGYMYQAQYGSSVFRGYHEPNPSGGGDYSNGFRLVLTLK